MIQPPQRFYQRQREDIATLEMYVELCQQFNTEPMYGPQPGDPKFGACGGLLDKHFWNTHHQALEKRAGEETK